MPRYESNPAAVKANAFGKFPTGDYEFVVGEPKPFAGTTKEGKNAGKDNYGVMFTLTCRGSDMDGQKFNKRCFEMNEDSLGMGKQFKMAVLGYKNDKAGEAAFDSDWGGKDWAFDTDSGAVGDAWREMTGKRVTGSLQLDIAKDGSGEETQKEKGWRPLAA